MAQTRHADDVLAVAQSNNAAAVDPIAASWRRSLLRHGLDPEKANTGHERLSDHALKRLVSEREILFRVAQSRVDALFSAVGLSGFCVALTDEAGVIMVRRSLAGDEDHFDAVGLCQGFNWSENAQGTNGIGTCLYEKRSVIVHRDEHFMSGNIGISCIDAPVFGAYGELIGALDVTSNRRDHTGDMNRMIGLSVSQFARQIEADVFAAAYAGQRIVVAPGDANAGACLLAVDDSDVVVGATRAARSQYGLGTEVQIEPALLNDILHGESRAGGFDQSEKMVIRRALIRAKGNASLAAKALGISRATLYRRMAKLGFERSGP